MEKIINWVKQVWFTKLKKNKVEFAILIAILAVGAFLRLYRIADYMTFLGDEGRDAIVVRRLLVYFDPILIGPGTSIGNMYLGPLYYYLIAPSLLLARFSPVGPSVFVALVGVATVFLVWKIGREWFGRIAGIIAAFFYAISPTVIIFSRSSWNPNVMPFFALLCIYSVWKIYQSREALRSESGSKTLREVGWWFIILGISFAFCLQSHYLGLLLLPTLGIYWFITFLRIKKDSTKENKKSFLRYSLFSVLLFLFLMSPLVIFDARHGWRNFEAMKNFFSVRQETVSIKPWNAIPKVFPIFEKVNIRLLAGRNDFAGKTISFAFVVFLLWLLFNSKKLTINHQPLTIILVWLGFALLGLGLYKKEIYDHYYGFFFPAPFILIGGIFQFIFEKKRTKLLLYFAIFCLASVNLWNTPVRYPPNFQLQRSEHIAKFIEEKSAGERFNIATISERNNRDVYQYFLTLWGAQVVDTDPSAVEYTVTNQLFVVCEKPKEKCDPVHDPSAWITNFGWTKIVDQWEVSGVNIYKLGHAK